MCIMLFGAGHLNKGKYQYPWILCIIFMEGLRNTGLSYFGVAWVVKGLNTNLKKFSPQLLQNWSEICYIIVLCYCIVSVRYCFAYWKKDWNITRMNYKNS